MIIFYLPLTLYIHAYLECAVLQMRLIINYFLKTIFSKKMIILEDKHAIFRFDDFAVLVIHITFRLLENVSF